MRVSVLGLIHLAVALSGAGIAEAQSTASPSTADVSAVLAELNGVWTLENDRGETSYVAFAGSPFAIYRGRLSEVDITAIRRYADAEAEAAGLQQALDNSEDLSEVSDRVGDVLVGRIGESQLDEAARERARTEASASINARLRGRLERLRQIMADAVEHGDGTLTTINIGFSSAPDLVGELNRRATALAYSGNRLYFVIRERIWIYDRVSTLSGQSAGDWPDGGRSAWEHGLSFEYTRLYQRCVVYQRSELPLDDCRAHRDGIAAFGVELEPEFVLERFRDFDKPTEAEMTFWRNRMPSRDTWSDTFPVLDYCYGAASSPGTIKDFVSELAGTGFKNTLWRLSLISNAPFEKPRNWTEQEFHEWAPGADQPLSSLQGAIFLRADGVLGFGPYFDGLGFDPRNRWTYSGGTIRLSLNDGSIEVQIPIADYVNAEGTTNLALAKRAFAALVLGNYDLLTKMPYPERHPDFERLKPFTESQRCDTGDLTTALAEPTPEPEPEVDWPTRKAGAFPTHWHARTDMTDGSEDPDPERWAGMQAGAYYYLLGADSARSGRLGVNINAPTGFAYDRNASWEVSGSTMTWRWSQFDTFVFELRDDYTGTISAVGQKNPQYTMVLTPTDLLSPQTRRLEVAAAPDAVAAQAAETSSTAAVRNPEPEPEPEPEPVPVVQPPAAVEPATLIGCWRWSNGARIRIAADGVAANGPVRGQWRSADAPNRFEVEWPPIEDTITLASNGRSFDGVGAFGIRYTATRIGQGDGLSGQWRRQDGVVLNFAGDGAASGGPLRGRWSGSGDSFRIEWPLIDEVTVSKDGERLDAVNQFGRVTAKRQPDC